MNEFFLQIVFLISFIQADVDKNLLPDADVIRDEMDTLRPILYSLERDIEYYKNFGWAVKSRALAMEKWLIIGRSRYEMLDYANQAPTYTDRKIVREHLNLYWWKALKPAIE